jgi:3-phenylpropionate/cinnamic acid dioxygenase small subunit
LNVKMLARALSDMTVPDWLEQLNRHVFFAPTPKRLEDLYGAYADQPRLVLTLDTRSLLTEHRYQTRLAAINTGAVRHVKHTRGSNTLQRVSIFDTKREVAEIAVINAVPDIAQHTTRVEVWHPDGSRTALA